MSTLDKFRKLLLHRDKLRLQLEHAEKALDEVAVELYFEHGSSVLEAWSAN